MALLQKNFLTIKNDHTLHDIDITLTHSPDILPQNIQTDLYQLLTTYKTYIDTSPSWNKIKKISNVYEYIYIYNKHINNNIGTALYNPLSRSFFKLHEMIYDLQLLQTNSNKLIIVGLAEAPGGFIECIYNFRHTHQANNKDVYYCMSLISNDNNIPSLYNLQKKIINNKLHIVTGEDQTGDIYNYKNIIYLQKKIGKKVDFVTADGGFNYDNLYNYQEQLSYKLIFSEIVTALHILKIGGTFVLKIFDIFTHNTFHLLFFVSKFFKEINIIKPFSSRPANSEKYVVCKSFIGITQEYAQTLLETLLDWNVINHNFKSVVNIFTITETPKYNIIMRALQDYNMMFVKEQIKNILTTLTLIACDLDDHKKEQLNYIQASMSFFWCLKYKMELNYKCKYLK